MSKKIVLFASGSGTNAENIIRYFQHSTAVDVVGVYTNKPKAGVIARAEKLGVPVRVFDKPTFNDTTDIQEELKNLSVNLVVLAGFLWKIPDALIRDFPGKIVNVHPALLPKFGGKGMYGIHVHRAVLDAGESKSGITIHLVNEQYDEGQIVFQKDIPVRNDDTPETLASRIHELEYNYYPAVIEQMLKS
jgi:phosphoribosylglycinamide formyltransferase-1